MANTSILKAFERMWQHITTAIADVVNNSWSLSRDTAIPSGADLNTYLSIGNYSCRSHTIATTLTNSPTTQAFSMKVYASLGFTDSSGSNYITQEIIPMNPTVATRIRRLCTSTDGGSTWTYGTWVTDLTSANWSAYVEQSSGGSGGSGMVREFSSGYISVSTYSYDGIESKFYMVTLKNTNDGTFKTVVIDYRSAIDISGSKNIVDFHSANGTWSGYTQLQLSVENNKVTITSTHEEYPIAFVCGYY